MKTTYSHIVLFARDYRTVASGWEGAPYLQEIRPGAGFKTGDFVEEKLGGAPENDSPLPLQNIDPHTNSKLFVSKRLKY